MKKVSEMNNKVKLSKNERKKYYLLLALIAFVFLFFFSSHFFFKERATAETTKVGQTLQLEDRTFTLVNRSYYPKEETLVFSFLSPVNSSNILDQLELQVKASRSDNENYHTKLRKISDDYYVVFISQLPQESWQSLAITVYPETKNLETIAEDQKFTFVQEEIIQSKHLDQGKTAPEYELEGIDFEQKQTQNNLKKQQKKKQKQEKEIEKINRVNEEIEDRFEEKTSSEKEELEKTIQQNESKMTTLEKDMTETEEAMKEYQAKLEKLNERQKKLQKQ